MIQIETKDNIKFQVTTEKVKEMADTKYTLVSSSGNYVVVRVTVLLDYADRVKGYEYRIGVSNRTWTYPHYAIVKAIKHLKGDVVSASVKYKRKSQIEILIKALYQEGVLEYPSIRTTRIFPE